MEEKIWDIVLSHILHLFDLLFCQDILDSYHLFNFVILRVILGLFVIIFGPIWLTFILLIWLIISILLI